MECVKDRDIECLGDCPNCPRGIPSKAKYVQEVKLDFLEKQEENEDDDI